MSSNQSYQVCILVAVWGETFSLDFLEWSLPSLLAPGNIPALAEKYPTRFVFLTRACDIEIIKQHPAYERLVSICEIDFHFIEDLIVFGNYSTTLTLAYDRAIKQTGEQMLQTYFLFLTSDYIMADGSLRNLSRYMQQGVSGVCAGNFQVIKSEMKPFLLRHIDPETHAMVIKPRELLRESFQHLHPIVFASVYNQIVTQNYYVNRFYYPYKPGLMAGRFYLLHMLCIKPEVMNYKIGSSCDYSFIPAMCPSGNIAIIQDSDEYLVVEVQSHDHELKYINWGAYQHRKLVLALSQWTTKQHRENAKVSIYYHVNDVTSEDKNHIEQALGSFIDGIDKDLKKYPPQPFYNHPYWSGAISSFQEHRSLLQNRKDFEYVDFRPITATSRMKKIYYRLFGIPPNVHRWHYRFREYQQVLKKLQNLTVNQPQSVIALYDGYEADFSKYFPYLKEKLKIEQNFYLKNLWGTQQKLQGLQQGQYAVCFLFIGIDSLNTLKTRLSAIKKMLKPDGKLLLVIPNERNRYPNLIYDFKTEFAHRVNSLIGTDFDITELHTVHNNFTLWGAMIIHRIDHVFSYSQHLRFAWYIMLGSVASVISTLFNCLPDFLHRKRGHCTNLIIELTPRSQPGLISDEV